MTNKHFFLSMAATALLGAGMTACTSDDPSDDVANSQQSIQFTASVSEMATSRAGSNVQSGTTLTVNAQVGLVATYEQNVVFNNSKLTVGSDGTTLTPESDLSFGDNTSLNFYAYTPYNSSYAYSSDAASLTFAVKDDQTSSDNYIASDLLYGKPASNPVPSETTTVALQFAHKLSKIVVSLTAEEGSSVTISSPKVTLLNVKKEVSLALTSGEATATETAVGSVVMNDGTASESNTFAAVVAPQTIASATNFVQIDLDGTTYRCKLGAEQSLVSGNVYSYTVTFKKAESSEDNTVSVNLSFNGTLSEWTNGSASTLDEPTAEVVYGIGDYLTSDGKFVKSNKVTTSDNVVGVIFATSDRGEISEKDKDYTAYILGLYDLSTDTKAVSTSDVSSLPDMDFTYESLLTNYMTDLDGLSHTTAILAGTNGATDYPLFDLSNCGLQNFSSNENFSKWFVPSAGQMFQILINLGGVEVGSSVAGARGFSVCPTTPSSTPYSSNNMLYELAQTPNLTTLIATLKKKTNNVEVFKSGKNYACAAYYVQKSEDKAKAYMIGLSNSFTGSDKSGEFGDCWGTCNGNITTARVRVACIATKLPLTNE